MPSEEKSSYSDRAGLIKTVSSLPEPLFEALVFALNPPGGILPAAVAAQGIRASLLLDWAENPDVGPGLPKLREVLDRVLGKEPELLDFKLTGDLRNAGLENGSLGKDAGHDYSEASRRQVQIFLAHAKVDKAAVFELYDRLKAKGYKPWLDKKDLIPGQNWRQVIPQAIKNSQIFIACLSQQSVNKQGYVQKEFRLALNEYAEKPPGIIYLIPLKLDDCEVPDLAQERYGVSLRDIHWLEYWEPDGFETLVRAIEYQYGNCQN